VATKVEPAVSDQLWRGIKLKAQPGISKLKAQPIS
jgi:hypothetical protein